MCRYVAIVVFQGLIENVGVFEQKEEATEWIGRLAEEYGPCNCSDSIIWDTLDKLPIDVAFAH